MEARPHCPIQQRIGDGDDRHALVVSHEGTHRRDALAFGYPARRVIQGFVKAIPSARTDTREALEISRCSGGIDHRCERRRVWRNYHVFCKTALQSEARDAEVRILISELQVACVVGGFRNSPWHPKL